MEEELKYLFGPAGPFYTKIIDTVVPSAVKHEYHFLAESEFLEWSESDLFNEAEFNRIVASELIDKAHLAAVTALIRTQRWVNAACYSYRQPNFLGWASSARGLIESSGDIVDGLLNVAAGLAQRHRLIATCLHGQGDQLYKFEIESALDHFVLAKWMRAPRGTVDPRKAKENIDYVRMLEKAHIPGIVPLYHRLCGIVHPSSASIDYLYNLEAEHTGMKLDLTSDLKAIKSIRDAYPTVLSDALMVSCNNALLVLRVLHKFKVHPQLPALKKLNWDKIPMWSSITRDLDR